MQAATNTELIEFNGWTLRVRQPNAAKQNLLVMLHGWTGDENSMWIFTRGLPSSYWMIAPRAPHPAKPSGYSWRPNDPDSFGRPSFEKLKPAADALLKLIDAYAAEKNINAAKFDVMGFSQGAAMTNMLGILYPQRIEKMGVLAGFVPGGAEALLAQKPLAGKHIFVAHGLQDEMIPIARARESISLLEQGGARVTYCEDDVAHKVSANCKRALEAYLKNS